MSTKGVDDTIVAPFTEDEVNALNWFQQHANVHPFTCWKGHTLRATIFGWICPQKQCDDFTQNWAYSFMVARNPLGQVVPHRVFDFDPDWFQ